MIEGIKHDGTGAVILNESNGPPKEIRLIKMGVVPAIIGALPIGCAFVAIKERTWHFLKHPQTVAGVNKPPLDACGRRS
jgi:hypothetical protein